MKDIYLVRANRCPYFKHKCEITVLSRISRKDQVEFLSVNFFVLTTFLFYLLSGSATDLGASAVGGSRNGANILRQSGIRPTFTVPGAPLLNVPLSIVKVSLYVWGVYLLRTSSDIARM